MLPSPHSCRVGRAASGSDGKGSLDRQGASAALDWLTPDYRSLAEAFAANLAEHGAPLHLFSKPALGGWDTSPKPAAVLEAMDRYPGKTIILAGFDCIICGTSSR